MTSSPIALNFQVKNLSKLKPCTYIPSPENSKIIVCKSGNTCLCHQLTCQRCLQAYLLCAIVGIIDVERFWLHKLLKCYNDACNILYVKAEVEERVICIGFCFALQAGYCKPENKKWSFKSNVIINVYNTIA